MVQLYVSLCLSSVDPSCGSSFWILLMDTSCRPSLWTFLVWVLLSRDPWFFSVCIDVLLWASLLVPLVNAFSKVKCLIRNLRIKNDHALNELNVWIEQTSCIATIIYNFIIERKNEPSVWRRWPEWPNVWSKLLYNTLIEHLVVAQQVIWTELIKNFNIINKLVKWIKINTYINSVNIV